MDYHPFWRIPPENIQLDRDEVHIWCASLDLPDDCLSGLAKLLSCDERHKANRFRFEQDRRHFVIGRSTLRLLLSHYLSEAPGELQFRYSPFGKPYLPKEFNKFDLRFNLAHSHGLALYAITCGREIGVDLEYTRFLSDAEQIVARFFSEQEESASFGLPAERQREAFYVLWTRKEAYLKALGCGLIQSLDRSAISSQLGRSANLQWPSTDSMEITDWFLETLVPVPGFVAALALLRGEYRLGFYQWIHKDAVIST